MYFKLMKSAQSNQSGPFGLDVMVFFYLNCSSLLWERIDLVIKKKLLKFEAEGQDFDTTRTIYDCEPTFLKKSRRHFSIIFGACTWPEIMIIQSVYLITSQCTKPVFFSFSFWLQLRFYAQNAELSVQLSLSFETGIMGWICPV